MRSPLTLESENLKYKQALWKNIKTIDQFKLEMCRFNKIVKTVTLDLVAFEQLTGKIFQNKGKKDFLISRDQ